MRTSLTRLADEEEIPNQRAFRLPALVRAMTRCECVGISFAEIGRLLEAGEPLPAALARTGCGSTCTACRPDLESYLASRFDPD